MACIPIDILAHADFSARHKASRHQPGFGAFGSFVRTLQRQGVRVSAVFMGEDSSAGAAAQIYGKNMARIRGMDQLARAAGRLIQNEIRALGD